MNKEEFKRTFERALTVAAENAERQLGRPVPRTFEIELHGLAPRPRNMSAGDALDVLYLGVVRQFVLPDTKRIPFCLAQALRFGIAG